MEHVEKLQDHLNRLEDKLKANFLEIEKRFSDLRVNLPANIDDRLQEMEDLLLLLQVENMTMKEKFSGDFDIGMTPKIPNMEERLVSVEAQLTGVHEEKLPGTLSVSPSLDARLDALEDKITALSKPSAELLDEIKNLEHRVDSLEHKPVSSFDVQEYAHPAEKSKLLDDIQMMLKSN